MADPKSSRITEFTRLLGNQLLNTKGFYDFGIKEGLTTAEDLRLTISKRRETAQAMIESGMSQRQVAKVLGVNEKTIRNDTRNNSAESAEKVRSPAEKRETALRAQLKLAQTPAVIPNQQYGTVIIDPPWAMSKIEREVRPNQVGFDYPTMDYEQLRAFRPTLQRLTAEHCHVYMWTTQRFLPMAFRLLEDYEVKYVCTHVWHKPGGFQPLGLPQYNCEFVLYGRIGTPTFIETTAFNLCFEAPRAEHSRKPDQFYDTIRRVTAGPRIDVFSREPRDGFDQYGNEPGKFDVA